MIEFVRPAPDLEAAVQALVAAAQPWLPRTEGEELVRNVVKRGASPLDVFLSARKAILHRNRYGWLRVNPVDVNDIARAMSDAWEGVNL